MNMCQALPEGRESIHAAALGVGDVSFSAGVIKLHGEALEEVDRAALLVEAVLEHRTRLQQRLVMKERLDAERAKVQDEIARGLRVEFSVPPPLMRLVVGDKVGRCKLKQLQTRV